MTYDDMITAPRGYEADSDAARLVELLVAWKTDTSDVHELTQRPERYFGNSWIADNAAYAALYGNRAQFRAGVVERIGGADDE